MEELILRGKKVKVDIRAELEHFDWGAKAKWTEDKLISPSPFRYDKSPSFFVNLTSLYVDGTFISAGTWRDSGYEYEEWASGNFIKLLSYLRQETYEETEEYLALVYGIELSYDELEFKSPQLTLEERRKPLPADWLTPYKYRHPYLAGRGITEKVQRMMRIGYDKATNAIVIPWLDGNQTIVNAKFRTVKGKIFWYTKDALPIKHNVYGMDLIYAMRAETAVVCEAEIDALTWLTWGVPAIALGGAYISDRQADIIKRSPIKHLIMGGDNDAKGEELHSLIVKRLSSHVELSQVTYPYGFKDANEVLMAGKPKPEITPFVPIFKINW